MVMSATLEHESISQLMPDAKYVESQGRSFPVEYRYHPLRPNQGYEQAVVAQIQSLIGKETGSLLAFLPSMAAIKRVAEGLTSLPNDVAIFPLYGQLNFQQQQAAIQAPSEGQRKVVLATNIAETSLTIEGIRIVLDSGLQRTARFDVKNGVTKLEQVRIAQSSAEQRAGRAGRLEPGICIRLYSESSLNQQPNVPPAEILSSDLSSLAIELAQWGASEPSELKWLDIPPQASFLQSKQLLVKLGLLDNKHQLTSRGKTACELGVEPRIAAMLTHSNSPAWLSTAPAVAALLESPERNIANFTHSVDSFKRGKHSQQQMVYQRGMALSRKLNMSFSTDSIDESLVAVMLAAAFPDRVAQLRSGKAGKFLLANGHGAELAEEEKLSTSEYLVIADLMRTHSGSSRIFLAAELELSSVKQWLPELINSNDNLDWDDDKGRLIAESQQCIGRLVVERTPLPAPPPEKITKALLNYVRRKGLAVLNWSENSKQLLERIRCAADWLPEELWPETSEAELLKNLEHWLEPYLTGVNSLQAMKKIDLEPVLMSYLSWPLNQNIDKWLPAYYFLPTGTKKKIRYKQGQDPVLSVRMQEMFGQQVSPQIAQGRKKLLVELLSPAQRPLQITSDLASFWASGYKEVQKEMKGRYPKHVWPDDPANHVATTKTKRQLNS